jgi:CheY-like chemotaxis protein
VAGPIRILVVEDEFLVSSVIDQGLTEAGFQVVMVASVDEAIATLNQSATSFAALVTDIYLNGFQTGWDVAKHARKLNPLLPVLYMTASSGNEFFSQSLPDSALLTKPFEMFKLTTAIRHLINKA